MNSYATDKNGWVKFPNPKKPKIKLRKWIENYARSLSTGTTVTLQEAKQLLIQYYDKDGLDGVTRCYNLKMQIKMSNPDIPIIEKNECIGFYNYSKDKTDLCINCGKPYENHIDHE